MGTEGQCTARVRFLKQRVEVRDDIRPKRMEGNMSKCISCGAAISGIGYCDICKEPLCYLCHEEVDYPDGTAVVCPKCKEKEEEPADKRWPKIKHVTKEKE